MLGNILCRADVKVFPGLKVKVWEPRTVSGRREVKLIKEAPSFRNSLALYIS